METDQIFINHSGLAIISQIYRRPTPSPPVAHEKCLFNRFVECTVYRKKRRSEKPAGITMRTAEREKPLEAEHVGD